MRSLPKPHGQNFLREILFIGLETTTVSCDFFFYTQILFALASRKDFLCLTTGSVTSLDTHNLRFLIATQKSKIKEIKNDENTKRI